MPEGLYDQLRDELLATRADIEAEIEKTKTNAEANLGRFLPIAVGLVDGWNVLPATARRDMLTRLIRHVKVFRTDDGELEVIRVD